MAESKDALKLTPIKPSSNRVVSSAKIEEDYKNLRDSLETDEQKEALDQLKELLDKRGRSMIFYMYSMGLLKTFNDNYAGDLENLDYARNVIITNLLNNRKEITDILEEHDGHPDINLFNKFDIMKIHDDINYDKKLEYKDLVVFD